MGVNNNFKMKLLIYWFFFNLATKSHITNTQYNLIEDVVFTLSSISIWMHES